MGSGIMKAILLAAGFGSRLKPITDNVPKCLLPVNGRPLMEYWIRNLKAAGIEYFLLNLHYLSSMMKEWLTGSEFAGFVETDYEEKILGTGGTLLKNKYFIGREAVMLIHADNLCFADFNAFVNAHNHRPAGTQITMMTFTTPAPQSCGIVELDEKGIVQSFHEKVSDPPGDLANAAVYIIEPEVVELMAAMKKDRIDFSTEVLPHYIGKIYTYYNNIYHRDIGTVESFLCAQTESTQKIIVSPEAYDAWTRLCRKQNIFLRMLLSLSKALPAGIIDYERAGLTYLLNNIPDSYRIVAIATRKPDIRKVIKFVTECELPSSKTILFFREVSADFSAKEIYDSYGLKSIAVSAHQ